MTDDLTTQDLKEILEFTISLARKAGSVIREGSEAIQSASQGNGVNEKKNAIDLVTEYDVKVEELVQETLKAKYPAFKFIGEESYSAGHRPPLTDDPTFCVDPIDGTTNFVHGFPFVCISLGLIYRRRPVLGVVYNPMLDQLYTGVTGQGSFLIRGSNPEPLRLPLTSPPKPLPSLSQALLAVEWGHDRQEPNISKKSESFRRLVGDPSKGVSGGKMAHALRSVGSAALNISLVAQGGLDLYWEIGCYPWDVCAGMVIAQEAGCVFTGSHEVFKKQSLEEFGDITEEILTGRKYVVVRAIGDAGEQRKIAQRSIVEEFYETVEDMTLN